MPIYTPSPDLVGKSPSDIRYANVGYGGRPDELAGLLGISENTPLENRPYNVSGDLTGQPGQFIGNKFSPTAPGGDLLKNAYTEAQSTLTASKPITEAAYTQRGNQLQGEIKPLTDRYQQLLDNITNAQNKDLTTQGNVLATEYGKRGIPLSSGAYQQDLANKDIGINQFYTSQGKDVTFERENKLRDISNLIAQLPIEKAQDLNKIDQAIANLKVQGADKATQMALEMYRTDREDKWKQQEADLAKQEYQLKQYQIQNPPNALKDQFLSLGEGSTLYNLLTGQTYTAPKSYKPESNSNNPAGI